ncbi:hypothetical protein KP806_16040 [Paenibacillus sp. N4]|uniref:hypothetical protein n=1 Tax=Paenibacillus vietnamensis TaxID=2590547 RepID=UPI001CD18F57|nr:hypothetical protein [Paenibacillus vietnamensis]MCA0756567.1 hypothetical protein [Paenibacillus vietnamensis]
MKKEHTVYFKVIRGSEAKLLTGLIYLEENTEPTLRDFAECLKQCGHDVQVEDERRFIFRSGTPGDDYLIDVLEDYKPASKDFAGDSLARSFVKKTTYL